MAGEKTEEPTQGRLKKAREEGDSGVSANAAQAIAFLAVVVVLPSAARAIFDRGASDLRAAIGGMGRSPVALSIDPSALGIEVLALTLPVLGAAALAATVMCVVQTGGFFATKKLTPKPERLNPFEGVKQLFSVARLFAVARALIGAAFVSWLAYRTLRAHAADLAFASGDVARAAKLAGVLGHALVRDAALIGLALGGLDLLVVRRGWMKRLRMTKEEVRREHKESQGDPHIKQARERAHHEQIAAITIASVRTASVVIVNPTHLACALRYAAADDSAPVLVAAGEGDLAARIVRAAHEFGVPVVRDVPMARALIELGLGDQIPEALYEAVAEILRETWETEGQPR